MIKPSKNELIACVENLSLPFDELYALIHFSVVAVKSLSRV